MKGVIYTTTKELLIKTPLPLQTNTYMPVAHEKIIDLTLEGITKAGFSVEKEIYSAAREGNPPFHCTFRLRPFSL